MDSGRISHFFFYPPHVTHNVRTLLLLTNCMDCILSGERGDVGGVGLITLKSVSL